MLEEKNIENLSSFVNLHAEKTPDKVYLIHNKIKYTYSQINKLINKVCSLYESIGLKEGDIISVVLKNGVEYVLLYLASLRYGCVFNPYPFNLEAHDLSKYINQIKLKILFCQERHFTDFKERGQSNIFLIEESFIEKLSRGDETDKAYVDFVPQDNTPACIYYSSGTTGSPKGIVFSHKNMVANISSIVRGFRFDDKTIHLIILPLGHTASINYSFLPCTMCGGTIVLAESFWKIRANFWKYIKEYEINYVEIVPSILIALLNTTYEKSEFEGIESLKFIGCGSSTLPKESQMKFLEKYGIKVANLYGLSETGPTHIDYPLDEGWKPGSVGVPLDVNEVKIIDEKGCFLGQNEIGEIVIRGDNIFIGYHNNPDLYKEVMKDEWFCTGDLGYINSNNLLFFTGRKKDLIIKGGVNISPDEIDEVIYKMNEIKEVITVGIPDEYLGEKIVSFVIPKKGSKISEKDILDFCKKHLSKDKIPDKVNFVDSIPKGPSGKLLRMEMKFESNGNKNEKKSESNKKDFQKELEIAKFTARAIGKIQLDYFGKSLKIIRKDEKEFVSNVDLECQKLAHKLLSEKFSYPVLSEEERITNIPDGYFWIIDPIDGTHNFISGLPNFGVSIALVSKKEFLLGVMYVPYFDDLFCAIKGKGTFLNEKLIRVSDNKQLEKSMITYDNQFHLNKKSFERYDRVIKHSFTTRILGSAIFDFGLIASGKIDARIWNNTKIFDFSAGIVIVKEAGGQVTDFEGNEVTLNSKKIIASNGNIHNKLINIINNKQVEKEV